MKNISIKSRLFLLVGLLLALLIGVSAASVLRLRSSNAVLETVYNDRVVPLKQLKAVSDGYGSTVVDTAHKVRDGALSPEQGIKAVEEARVRIAKEWKGYI